MLHGPSASSRGAARPWAQTRPKLTRYELRTQLFRGRENDLDPPIQAAILRGIVGGDRVILAIASGREHARIDLVVLKEFYHRQGPSHRQLPIGPIGPFGGWNVVGMSLDANDFRLQARQSFGDLCQRVLARLTELRRARGKENLV